MTIALLECLHERVRLIVASQAQGIVVDQANVVR